MNKKTYEINFVIDDYKNQDYDSNMFPFKEFYKLDKNDQILMLESIKRNIDLYLDLTIA